MATWTVMRITRGVVQVLAEMDGGRMAGLVPLPPPPPPPAATALGPSIAR